MMRTVRAMAVWLAFLAAGAQAAASVEVTPVGAPTRSRMFIDQSLAFLRQTAKGMTTATARISLTQRTLGMNQSVTIECRAEFRRPDVLLKDVRDPYAYSVSISNGIVTTAFPRSREQNVRPLATGEDLLADFLGIYPFYDEESWDFDFQTQGNIHVLIATMRPREQAALARDILRNTRVSVRRTIWIDTDQRRILKTYRATLGRDEETCEFRDLVINFNLNPFAE